MLDALGLEGDGGAAVERVRSYAGRTHTAVS